MHNALRMVITIKIKMGCALCLDFQATVDAFVVLYDAMITSIPYVVCLTMDQIPTTLPPIEFLDVPGTVVVYVY